MPFCFTLNFFVLDELFISSIFVHEKEYIIVLIFQANIQQLMTGENIWISIEVIRYTAVIRALLLNLQYYNWWLMKCNLVNHGFNFKIHKNLFKWWCQIRRFVSKQTTLKSKMTLLNLSRMSQQNLQLISSASKSNFLYLSLRLLLSLSVCDMLVFLSTTE